MRRSLIFVIVVAVMPTLAWGQGRYEGPPQKELKTKALPNRKAGGSNPCAAYGAGFVAVEGTSTCIKIGGAVSIGGSVGLR